MGDLPTGETLATDAMELDMCGEANAGEANAGDMAGVLSSGVCGVPLLCSSSPNISSRSWLLPFGVALLAAVRAGVAPGVTRGAEDDESGREGLRNLPLAFKLRKTLCVNSFVNDLILAFFSSLSCGCRCDWYETPRFSFSTRIEVHWGQLESYVVSWKEDYSRLSHTA